MEPSSVSSSLLVITLGPVQDFIATARRCRDLWFGSWLLSELSKAAARSIVQTPCTEMIFPPPDSTEDKMRWWNRESVANKIVAQVHDPESVAKAAEQAARGRLEELAANCFDQKQFENKIDRVNANEQIKDLLEWNWAAAPIEASGFASARARAERLLAARKGCRDFAPVVWGSVRPKSSLDGARESVISKQVYEELNAKELYEKLGVRPGEQLCGVGLFKRHGQRGYETENRVFSTSHVAAQSLLQRWQRLGHSSGAGSQILGDFESRLRSLGLGTASIGNVPTLDIVFGRRDGHLLYESRLSQFFDNPQSENIQQSAQEKEAALRHLTQLLSALNENKKPQGPLPYYALILADGDKMGASISRADTVEKNQQLSQQLSKFAAQTERIVNRGRGSLIYAGGDDVLALLPLHNALATSRAMADAFTLLFQVEELNWLTEKPTLSLGMAIVHHLEPLSEALELARGAEKRAKSVPGKNALAITLNKRSGGENTVAAHWSLLPNSNDGLDERLGQFIQWARLGEVAAGLAYEWRDLTLRVPMHLVPTHILPASLDAETAKQRAQYSIEQHNETVSALWLSEAKRFLNRKKERGGNKPVVPHLIQKLTILLDEAHSLALPGESWLSALSDELIIAREFAAAQDLALEPLTTAIPGTTTEQETTGGK